MRRVLAFREFRLLWLAQSLSVIGDNIVLVALALFIIDKTGSATDLGIVLAGHALSLVTFLLIGGVWADRLPRHLVMVVTDLMRFALHALLCALIFSGEVQIWEVLVIEILFGAAEAFSRPAASGLLPQTVPEADIQQATALTTMSNNVAEFVGPALASALVLGAGAGWAFGLDAATFLLSALLLARVRPRERGAPAPAPQERTGLWESVREGSAEVRSRTWVWATLASFCAALFFGLAPWFVLGPIVAKSQYGHVSVYGFVEAALGVGTIVGSLIGLGWRPRHPMRMAMIAVILWPITSIMYADGVTLAVVVPATALAGAGIALFDVWWLTALAERIPPDRLSRVTAYDWMVSGALLPLGYVLAGPLASRIGAEQVLLIGSSLAIVAFALGLVPRETRMLERIDVSPARPIPEDSMPVIRHKY
jgi:MFS family permease